MVGRTGSLYLRLLVDFSNPPRFGADGLFPSGFMVARALDGVRFVIEPLGEHNERRVVGTTHMLHMKLLVGPVRAPDIGSGSLFHARILAA